MKRVIRVCGLLGPLAISAPASASFDLILQSDTDTNLGAHIDRYDPVSRVYLGSFAINAPAERMTASHATKRIYTTSSNRVDEFEYSTGSMVRSYSVAGPLRDIRVSASGSELHILTATFIRTYNLTTLATNTVVLTGTTNASTFELLPNGNFLVADEGSQTWRLYNGGSLLSSVGFVSHTTLRTLSLRPDFSTSVLSFRGSDGTASLRGVNVSGSSLNVQQTNVANLNGSTGTTSAHQGMYAIGISSATPTQLRAQYVLPNGLTGFGFNLAQTSSLTGQTAIVLAPEPGSVAALGLGAIALLRRRRRRMPATPSASAAQVPGSGASTIADLPVNEVV